MFVGGGWALGWIRVFGAFRLCIFLLVALGICMHAVFGQGSLVFDFEKGLGLWVVGSEFSWGSGFVTKLWRSGFGVYYRGLKNYQYYGSIFLVYF